MSKVKVTLSLEFVFSEGDEDMPIEDAQTLIDFADDYEFLADFLRRSSYTLTAKKEDDGDE